MHVMLDHLAAVIIGSGILLIFALIQVRGTQGSADVAINHAIVTEITQVTQFLHRDIENMRTQTQTEEAITRGNFTGGVAYLCEVTFTGNITTQFTFPTLANPGTASSLADPDDADVVLVSYGLTDTGKKIDILENGTTRNASIYRLDRMVGTNYTGGSGDYITHFLVEFSNQGSTAFSAASSSCSDVLAKVRFEIKAATQGVEFAATNQRSTSQLNISRYGETISLANME